MTSHWNISAPPTQPLPTYQPHTVNTSSSAVGSSSKSKHNNNLSQFGVIVSYLVLETFIACREKVVMKHLLNLGFVHKDLCILSRLKIKEKANHLKFPDGVIEGSNQDSRI